jgi:maltoporin
MPQLKFATNAPATTPAPRLSRTTRVAAAATCLAACLATTPTWAAEAAGAEFNGYLRAGTGQNGKSGRSQCFQLEGAATKYRLGNECDAYGEFLVSKDVWQTSDGAKFKLNFMPNFYAGNQTGDSFSNPTWDVAQLFVQGRDIPELGGAKVWVGRRFFQRELLHIADFYHQNPTGTGGGIEDIALGSSAKLAYAFFRDNGANSKEARSRHYLSVRDIALYEGAALNTAVQFINKDSANITGPNHGGYSLMLQHVQTVASLAGANKLTFQYGVGASVTPGGGGGNFLGAWFGPAGPASNDSSVKRTRLVNDFSFQANANLGGQLMAVWQQDKAPAPAGDSTWTSLGGRVSYAFTNHIKLLGELGNDVVKPNGQPTRNLTKFTIAPTFAAERGFWSRPELRLYYTYAKWNKAAQAAADVGNAGSAMSTTGVFGTATNGSNMGVQVEAWF